MKLDMKIHWGWVSWWQCTAYRKKDWLLVNAQWLLVGSARQAQFTVRLFAVNRTLRHELGHLIDNCLFHGIRNLPSLFTSDLFHLEVAGGEHTKQVHVIFLENARIGELSLWSDFHGFISRKLHNNLMLIKCPMHAQHYTVLIILLTPSSITVPMILSTHSIRKPLTPSYLSCPFHFLCPSLKTTYIWLELSSLVVWLQLCHKQPADGLPELFLLVLPITLL